MCIVECTAVQWGTSVSGGMVTHKGLSCLLHSLIKQSHHWTITMTLIYQWHHHDHHITVSSEKDFQEGRDTNQIIFRGWPAEFEANWLAQHCWEGDIFLSMHQCIASSQYGNCSFLWYSGTKQVLIRETFWQKWCWAVFLFCPHGDFLSKSVRLSSNREPIVSPLRPVSCAFISKGKDLWFFQYGIWEEKGWDNI